jgi:hypothetical protein
VDRDACKIKKEGKEGFADCTRKSCEFFGMFAAKPSFAAHLASNVA